MTATSTAALGRARARSLMTSTCRIFTPGAPATDPVSGEVTFTETDVVTSPCRVRPAGTAGNTSGSGQSSGGAEVIAVGYMVSLPFAVDARRLQRLVVTASPDPSLVGLSLEVRQVQRGDNITARRLLCEEVS